MPLDPPSVARDASEHGLNSTDGESAREEEAGSSRPILRVRECSSVARRRPAFLASPGSSIGRQR